MFLFRFSDALPNLLEHISYIDRNITRPMREYNDCQVNLPTYPPIHVMFFIINLVLQEAVKQCYSVEANCYRTKSSKKEKEMIV